MMPAMMGILRTHPATGPVDPFADDVMLLSPFDEAAGTSSGWAIYGQAEGNSWARTNSGGSQPIIATSEANTLFGLPALRIYKTVSNREENLNLASIPELALAESDAFTVELFYYRVSSDNFTASPMILQWRHRDGSNNLTSDAITWSNYATSKNVQHRRGFDFPPSGWYPDSSSGYSMSTSAWSHVALVRSGTTESLYVEGTRVANYTQLRSTTSSADLYLASLNSGSSSNSYEVYIAQLRITRAARYSGTTLEVPTEPFPIP